MYAIVGANGFLGSYLIRTILDTTSDKIIAAARNIKGLTACDRILPVKCDITLMQDVEDFADIVQRSEPCKLIYLAAYHNIDAIAQNQKEAWSINITALASFLNTVDHLRCLFFASTDCVYGEGTPDYRFTEHDPLQPISLYGVQKAAAECLVTAQGHCVLRLPYMFGASLSPQKKHFYDRIIADLSQGKKVNMYIDSVRSALDYATAADIAVLLAEKASHTQVPNVLNLCGDEALSKYDLGLRLAKKEALPERLIIPAEMKDGREIFQAKRASFCLMDNTLLKRTLGLNELKISM